MNNVKIKNKTILVAIFSLLIGCKENKEKAIQKQDSVSLIIDSIHVSDSLNIALKRIKKFDDGIGNNGDVMKNYEIERDSYLKEIDIIYKKLLQKIKKDNSDELANNLIDYHEEWKKYLNSKCDFESNYIMDQINSGEYIFYLKPFFEKEYKSKLSEYYELYEFSETP